MIALSPSSIAGAADNGYDSEMHGICRAFSILAADYVGSNCVEDIHAAFRRGWIGIEIHLDCQVFDQMRTVDRLFEPRS